MNYWVIYDISETKVRNYVVKLCKNYGLLRVQKSAFLGTLSKNKAEMLGSEIEDALNKETDVAFLIPACEGCMHNKIIVGFLDEERVREKDFYLVE
ncbi:MAG: CRISPR-associated endonuclease Cas2 [Candidatus Micrarchaeia archaeon]